MTVTASSGSTRVTPQRYDTLPLSRVRQAEQQDRFPDGGELDGLSNFFLSGQLRLAAARSLSENAEFIVAKAANRIFAGGTPLSYLDNPIGVAPATPASAQALAADQAAFQQSVQTFAQGTAARSGGNVFSRLLEGAGGDGDVRVELPAGFSPIAVGRYGTERMKKSIRDLAWFLRYVGYALVAGDPSILKVNTRGLADVLDQACSLAATNVALQEMRAAAAGLLKDNPPARQLVIQYFNVLIGELAIPTPSAKQRLGSAENQGLQLPASYAMAAEGAQRFNMKPGMSGAQKAEVIRAAYRQVFERDIAKAYSQVVSPVEATQVRQGDISMREFIRALGHSKEYRQQFYGRFSNSRAVELAFRHFLGRGISSREEFTRYFDIVSAQGLWGLVDSLINSSEYAQVFGEETVPYLRDLGEEAQESAGWGSNRKLFRFSAPFEGAPQYVTLYAAYRQPFADQHVYGGGNDPLALNYGAIFPSGTASVATRPAPYGYDARRILIGNGLVQPGQMNSAQFRKASPRRLGPKVVRLQQISTGGASVPRRGGQPSIRGTEASTQAVIRAVYNQVLGNTGYAGEQSKVEEIKLENGDISLREFVRQVARSEAFRRRYWSGLYITKAIEVMHRRLIGRPTFGRWEINAYFDTAARKGFYGVVDAMLNSAEYNESFGEDTVPFERFITASDRNARQVPSFKQAINASGYVEPPAQRPNALQSQALRTVSGDLVPRNLVESQAEVFGTWSAQISGGQTMAPSRPAIPRGPGSVLSAPEPTRRWNPATLPSIGGAWQPAQSLGRATSSFNRSASPNEPGASMAKALQKGLPQGFGRRQSLAPPLTLVNNASESELQEALEASYKQLLNRVPFDAERPVELESKFRNNQLTVAQLVDQLTGSELFQERLNRMAPLRAASAAYLALLGRAAQPKEVSVFLATRANSGQRAAIEELLSGKEYAEAFGENTVPYIRGMATADGLPLSTVNRTASLYSGNAGLNPGPKAAI
ncbi:phycobilisome rod-core linker polypeptide [Cyanobium sp. WAJ14-Wanaka]|uniref:phycobilisome rod-core linker polypeptide n=1 Tax=Cyanobium sp. WAJ14-Wanaka TaxID=2823725 RepID=UPI0020CC48C0|nr:phycobilisome rod-core linker polypeptide [Cyanobium sp. WAJ14-Wanaka]MCP9775230.1 phycobilisome rod-core linker polypeptide [Cyanobium sp. WAJ14-Wanaka]